MKRRLYFMLSDVAHARAILDELLLARVKERSMHFYAKEGMLPADMPEASFLQKTDLVHGAQVGMLVGGAVGLLVGILLVMFPPEGIELSTVAILIAALGGALFGTWASTLVAAAIPNSRLNSFKKNIERGQILLMLDLPHRRVSEIEGLIRKQHPEVKFIGVEPHIPVFP